MVVDELWRANGLAEMISEAGLVSEIPRTDENNPLVRTAPGQPQLMLIAREWTRVRSRRCRPTVAARCAAELRAWTLAAGTPEADDRYLLGLDPHAPDTHAAAGLGADAGGIAPTLIGTRGSRPALRISGRRRLSRLVENVGEPPEDTDAFAHWPRI